LRDRLIEEFIAVTLSGALFSIPFPVPHCRHVSLPLGILSHFTVILKLAGGQCQYSCPLGGIAIAIGAMVDGRCGDDRERHKHLEALDNHENPIRRPTPRNRRG